MDALNKRKRSLVKKLEEYSEFLKGSITSICSSCNRANCICIQTSTKKAYRLTFKNKNNKSQTIYLAKEKLSLVRRMLNNYKKRKELSEKLLEINIELFRRSLGK